jgi:hypothetical protein
MISAREFEMQLNKATVEMSGFTSRLHELHMSSLHLSEIEIFNNYWRGIQIDAEILPKLYHGRWAERGFLERVVAAMGASFKTWTGLKISAYGGRLIGNVDWILEERVLLEYKTVPTIAIVEDMRKHCRVPYKVQCQVQSYLLWGKFSCAFLVIESREGGYPWVMEVNHDAKMQETLMAKAERVLEMIDALKPTTSVAVSAKEG